MHKGEKRGNDIDSYWRKLYPFVTQSHVAK